MKRIGLAAALALAALVVFALARGGPQQAPPAPAAPPGAAQRAEAAPDAPGAAPSPDDPLPPSLRGTSPSGGLDVDAQGHFVATHDAMLLFEYFLSAGHEAPLPELTERIRREIRARLQPPADGEAEAFLAHYLAYREQGAAEFSDPSRTDGADLEQRLQWLREFRRAWFGPEVAERLFRKEEDAVAVRLAMRRVGSDPTLDEAARLREAVALEEQHPESVRAARERAAAPLLHAREERALREAGADPAEIHALRVERFGPEAAERMRSLDAERSAWNQRMAVYRTERDRILLEAHEPDSAAAALEALRAAHFQPEERERVRLLDRVEATQAEGGEG